MNDGSPSLNASPPPLRIHHILAATTVTAVFLSLAKVVERHDHFGGASFVQTNLGIAYAIATSLALTGVGFGIYWRRLGVRFFHQPGHWLLIKKALGIWMVIAASYLLVAEPLGIIWRPNTVISLTNFAVIPASMGISLWAALQIADTASWRIYFIVDGFMVIVYFALTFLFSQWPLAFGVFSLAERGILLTLLLSAALADKRSQRTRDWAHWLGVFIYITIYVAAIAADIGLLGLPK
jgi:hypothetical protein